MSSKTEGVPERGWALPLAATIVVAAVLRLAGLQSGLWYDEIVTLVVSARLPFARIVTSYPDLNVHPLYSLLAHASMVALGESAWSLRLPACLFGVGMVAMTYVLGTRLVTRAEAWAGAAVLAVSYHHIWFSQNARGYTMLGFFALLSTHLLLRALETDRPGYYLGYALACTAGLYTHLTMGFVVAGHVTVAALSGLVGLVGLVGRGAAWSPARAIPVRTLLRTWTVVALMAMALYAPYAPGLLTMSASKAPAAAAQVATASWALGEAVRGLFAGEGAAAALAGGLLAAIGGLSLLSRRPLALALIVMPGVLTVLGVLALGLPLRPRFLFFLSGAAAICVGRGIGAIAAVVSRRTSAPGEPVLGIVGLALVMVILSAIALPRNYRLPKQDFEAALRFLGAAESQGNQVVVSGPACVPFQQYYAKGWPCWTTTEDWQSASGSDGRVLMVYTLADYIADPSLRAHLARDCPVVRRFAGTLGGGDITICEAHAGIARRARG